MSNYHDEDESKYEDEDDKPKLVENRGGTYCDFCDERISRVRLSIFDLMKKGGTVVQLLEPVKFEAMMGSSMGSAHTITSLEDGIACSKKCAEKLLKRFVRKHPEEFGKAFVALSGQELRRLGTSIDTKAYIDEAWGESKNKLLANANRMVIGAYIPTTFQSYANALEAPRDANVLTDGEVLAKETLAAGEAIIETIVKRSKKALK